MSSRKEPWRKPRRRSAYDILLEKEPWRRPRQRVDHYESPGVRERTIKALHISSVDRSSSTATMYSLVPINRQSVSDGKVLSPPQNKPYESKKSDDDDDDNM